MLNFLKIKYYVSGDIPANTLNLEYIISDNDWEHGNIAYLNPNKIEEIIPERTVKLFINSVLGRYYIAKVFLIKLENRMFVCPIDELKKIIDDEENHNIY
jgi:hypothetical protein